MRIHTETLWILGVCRILVSWKNLECKLCLFKRTRRAEPHYPSRPCRAFNYHLFLKVFPNRIQQVSRFLFQQGSVCESHFVRCACNKYFNKYYASLSWVMKKEKTKTTLTCLFKRAKSIKHEWMVATKFPSIWVKCSGSNKVFSTSLYTRLFQERIQVLNLG